MIIGVGGSATNDGGSGMLIKPDILAKALDNNLKANDNYNHID